MKYISLHWNFSTLVTTHGEESTAWRGRPPAGAAPALAASALREATVPDTARISVVAASTSSSARSQGGPSVTCLQCKCCIERNHVLYKMRPFFLLKYISLHRNFRTCSKSFFDSCFSAGWCTVYEHCVKSSASLNSLVQGWAEADPVPAGAG